MQLSLLAAAGLAASTTNAFLLPPDISASDDDLVKALPVPVEVDLEIIKFNDVQSLELTCPGCPVRLGKDGPDDVKFSTDVPSHLELDFMIDAEHGTDRLMLNGFELYPNSDPFTNSLFAHVQPEVSERRPSHFKGARPVNAQALGFGLQTQPVTTSDDEDGLELVMVELQIIEVGDVFVGGIPKVQVKLVKTPSDKLMIGAIETTEPDTPQNNQECTSFLCKWKAMLAAKLRKPHGCGRRPGSVKGSPPKESSKDASPEESAPQESAPQDASPDEAGVPMDGSYDQTKHGMARIFRGIVTHVLLPVIIGVMAGVSISIIGMMVGTLIVFVWRTFFRSADTRSYHGIRYCNKAAHNEVALGDEKSGLMVHQEEVEAPPAYLDSVVTSVDDKNAENQV
ncbi:Uu.00g110840.m01.CDS01 [Anthostomella pinea]|uniref:Uu.00g110840.m01.CDS01 n=1 Tax=Anthostomella pinea TaxID=933095 RepID=A0AAI8YGB5_9PEZI|nr:Uu.00g110840.m01.CDS01 [Anthostomella pinea]